MKHIQKILSAFLALILSVTIAQPAFAAPKAPLSADELTNPQEYEQYISVYAQESSTHRQFRSFMRTMRFFVRLFSGTLLLPDQDFNVLVDGEITEYCNYIKDNSDLDVLALLTNLPETKYLAELTVRVFGIDTEKMRDAMYDKRDQYWSEGKYVLSGLYTFLGVYFSVMEQCDVTAIPTNDPDVHEVILRLTYRDGSQEELHPGIFINTVTGEAYNKDGSGMVSVGFNCSIYDLLVYAPINAWMRNYGFCFFYDFFCYLSPNWMWHYTTRRFKFTYAGKDWMIQLWKGNYLITNGGEIGLYNRPRGRIGSYYNCATDDELLEMSMTITHGNEQILSLGPVQHWWLNGFKMSKEQYEPSSLTMDATIVMRDVEMLDAFCDAIEHNYRHDVSYTVDGLAVHLEW